MKIYWLSVVILVSILSACQPPKNGPCNQALLEQILAVDIGDGHNLQWISEKLSGANLKMNGFSFTNPRWEISERGKMGCSISLYGEVNGSERLSLSYFANLDDHTLYGDDKDSQFIMENFHFGKFTFTTPEK
jgi:hypothetical protein